MLNLVVYLHPRKDGSFRDYQGYMQLHKEAAKRCEESRRRLSQLLDSMENNCLDVDILRNLLQQ